ncbi:MAG: type II secretion system protein [Alphaproteobacteria bacterium]|nr:type II secretion system protein [Alphaproteobacteria bacterium]
MSKIPNITKLIQRDQGMTLIDLAIAVLVLGLILTPLIQMAKNYELKSRYEKTQENVEIVEAALKQFYYKNSRLPCPADLTLSPNDADYGKAVEQADVKSPPCLATSLDDISGVNVTGAVPFQDLRIPAEAAMDGWNNKLTYSVARLTTQEGAVMDDTTGVIEVYSHNQNPNPGGEAICSNATAQLTDKGFWVVLSHGPNGYGAYTPEGELHSTCTNGGNHERENCLNVGGPASNAAFWEQTCSHNMSKTDAGDWVSGARYDDYMAYGDKAFIKPWETYYALEEEPDREVFSKIDLVGIHNNNPQFELDVRGNVLLDDESATDPDKKGFAMTNQICDENGDNCFSPALIGGLDAAMNCSSGAMAGIANNAANCDVGLGTDFMSGSCGDDQHMIGINLDGSPTCAGP